MNVVACKETPPKKRSLMSHIDFLKKIIEDREASNYKWINLISGKEENLECRTTEQESRKRKRDDEET